MECVQAQQVISTALDREPVDAYQLEEAKLHCRTCPECGVFVRAQLVATQVPLPEPPADLADRVVARIRAEASAAQAAAAEASAATAAAAAQDGTPDRPASVAIPPTPIATLAPKPRTALRLPRMWVSAAAAGAVILALIATGVVVVFGMKQMSAQPVAKSTVYRSNQPPAQAPGVSANLGAGAAATPTYGSAETTGGQSITVNEVVYKLAGPAKIDTRTSTIVGSTTTSLGKGNSVLSRAVWAGPTPGTVYVADDAGNVFAFTRVTRSYAGLTFVMTSGEVNNFAQWPGLPPQINPPATADGAPTFTFDGTDASGVRVYRLTNSSATQGIAIAPGSAASDPAAGNPNWTWWAILH